MRILTYKLPCDAHLTAWSRSASSKMMVGLFPPSSKVTTFKFVSAAVFKTFLPVAVLPVKATLLMSGCSLIAWPTVAPSNGCPSQDQKEYGEKGSTVAIDDVDDSWRESRLVNKTCELQSGEGGEF